MKNETPVRATATKSKGASQGFRTVATWAAQIQGAFAQGRTDTIELAKLLCAAKGQLRYGQWAELWRSGQIPFSKTKGEMLVVVGKGMGGLDVQNAAQLPMAWNTLYYLARLPQPLLEQLIHEGTIHPAITLGKARELWRRFKGVAIHPDSWSRVQQRVNRFTEFVLSNLDDWALEERQWMRSELIELADDIATTTGESRLGVYLGAIKEPVQSRLVLTTFTTDNSLTHHEN